jgi:hypothetical protein
LYEEGKLELVLEKVLEFRERKLSNMENHEFLDGGACLPIEDAT